jgi:hypothetical protein
MEKLRNILFNFVFEKNIKMMRSFFKKSMPTRLGRWARSHDKRKVDLSNHDHCGGDICGKPPPKKEYYDSSMDFSICALQSFHVHPQSSKKKS